MAELDKAFTDFDETLKLTLEERTRAIELHNRMTLELRHAHVITSAFLQGSFARKTMRRPLHDVDKVVLLPVDQYAAYADSSGPDRAMDAIQTCLQDVFPDAKFSRSRHALNIEFPGLGFSFDVVPAFDINGSGDIFIATRGGSGGLSSWEPSNTRELITVVADRNQTCGGQFVHYVRMVKEVLDDLVPGLHVESFVYDAVTEQMPYLEACLVSLESAYSMLGSEYYDPTGADMISKCISPAEKDAARHHVEKALSAYREATLLGA